jgi:UDP:flavonoid glycosyltransferase YjiC (YdhE family)
MVRRSERYRYLTGVHRAVRPIVRPLDGEVTLGIMATRVLITSPATVGHILPMVPLATALVTRGHEVLWATPVAGVAHVEAAGFRGVGVSSFVMRPDLVRDRYPEIEALAPAEVPDVMFGKGFGAMATPPMLEGLLPVATEWRPHLVVCDAADFAGHIVAAELAVPSVTKGFGPLLPEHRVALAGHEVAPLWRSRGLEPPPYGGAYEHLYLDPYPPELAPSGPAPHIRRRQALRPVAPGGSAVDPADLPLPGGPADTPLVYLTLGTVFNDPAILRTVVAALGALPVRVLVTVGPNGDPAALGELPANVRAERYVDQEAVLGHCDHVVSHAGSGTVLGALARGLPQLCLPQGADQFLNAAAVASCGAGLALPPSEVDEPAVALAVGRVLQEPRFRDAAGLVADSIASMPSADDVVRVLEASV